DGKAVFFLSLENDGPDLRILDLARAAGSSPLGGGRLEQGGGQEGGDSSGHKRLAPEVLPEGNAPLLTSPLSQPPPAQGGGTPFATAEIPPGRPYGLGRPELIPILGGG